MPKSREKTIEIRVDERKSRGIEELYIQSGEGESGGPESDERVRTTTTGKKGSYNCLASVYTKTSQVVRIRRSRILKHQLFPWEESPKFGGRTMLSYGLRSQNWLISRVAAIPTSFLCI